MTKRTLIGVGAAALAVGALFVVPALAQEDEEVPETDISAKVQVSSHKAGTKQRPKGVAVSGTARIVTEPGFDPPIVTGVDIYFSPGFNWNGSDYVKCSKRVLDAKGPKGCPKESIMGDAVATARADTVKTAIDVVFVNAGTDDRLYAYATLENPARVQETIVIETTTLKGRWRYKDTIRVPKSLQVVAGVPIQVTGMKLSLGGKPYARNFITTTSCPKGGWRYQAKAHYLYDLTGKTSTDTVNGGISCTS